MRLYLARHGEAIPKHVDPQSPLSPAGAREARIISEFLSGAMVDYRRVFHSGKTRARQTAEIFAQAAGYKARLEILTGIDPMDPPELIVPLIESWSEDSLLVGHNPFMGRLFDILLAGPGFSGYMAEFATCAAACLQRRSGGGWTLQWMISPELFLGRD